MIGEEGERKERMRGGRKRGGERGRERKVSV